MTMSTRKPQYHLHLETGRKRPAIFHLTEEKWIEATKRHRLLAKKLKVTIGWDNEILEQSLQSADFMINSFPPKNDLRLRAPRLQWIQTTSAGVDGLMPFTWLPKDIVLTNNTGAHGAKAEESCLMALLMLQSRMPEVIKNQQNRHWQGIFTTPIHGKTVVILGFGDLGQGAGRAAKKLGMPVIAVTRSGKAHRLADKVVKTNQLDKVLPKADFVIVTTPLTAETRGLLNKERIQLLKEGAGFINIGRSPIVDYVALANRLQKGELLGAVLDVFDQEPLAPTSTFWETQNLMVLPHISCDDPRYIDHLYDFWFFNFERFLNGKKLKNIVDRQLGY
jgi:phosphoglycerate dehydrogenase-like enzyme